MGQIRLENLAILCIESTDTKNFDYTKAIDIFAKAKSRKKIL
jgi:predicted 3-demethylubiquinone-9 3-methyltransferase (glyoxalase superfamily)